MNLPNEPTNNPEYNWVLQKWAKSGYPSNPECEECEKDLTGENVIELDVGWYCEDCAENYEGFYEDPHYERKQMGLTDF